MRELRATMITNSVLLFVHPPFFKVEDAIYFDKQAQNGLRLWAENFEGVRVMAPLLETTQENVPSDAGDLQPFLDSHPDVEPIMLPRNGTRTFLTKDLRQGRKEIAEKIDASRYLVFAFSGYLGDWGTVACLTAARKNRPFAAFKDSVDHHIAQVEMDKSNKPFPQRMMQHFQKAMIKHRDRLVLKKSSLALLHGQNTMEYYAPYASNPHLVHDIHLSKSDHIAEDTLEQRLAQRDKALLRVVYAGRVEEIKGPDQWVEIMQGALAAGANLTARWYGTGALYDKISRQVAQTGPDSPLSFMGFVPQHQMLQDLHQADVFVFTHLTDESPRCLIEALTAGLPIVGYDSAFARDLVGSSQAGLFVPRGDTAALTRAVTELATDPERLAAMSRDARKVAEPMNDRDVFRHRSDIIKEAL